jgi:hypothetical protein
MDQQDLFGDLAPTPALTDRIFFALHGGTPPGIIVMSHGRTGSLTPSG